MSISALTFILKSTCFLYIKDKILKNKNNNEIFEFYTYKPFSTNSLIYIDLNDDIDKIFILSYDHDNLETNKNFNYYSAIKISFERQFMYSTDGKILCFINNKFVLKYRKEIEEKFIVMVSIDKYNLESITNQIKYNLYFETSLKFKLKTKDNKYICINNNILVDKILGTTFSYQSTNKHNTNKIIKLDTISESNNKELNNTDNIYLICFDHLNSDYTNERKIIYNIFGNVLKINRKSMILVFEYYGYFDDSDILIVEDI